MQVSTEFLFIILKRPSILNEVEVENIFFCEGSFMDNFIGMKM